MQLLAGRSIAVRLAVSSLFWSSFVLLVAGIILSTVYRQATERGFDERLLVYANDLAAELVQPPDDGRGANSIGDPRFEIPLSGWYWQVGRVDAPERALRSSRSLLANTLPMLAEASLERPFGQIRKENRKGPEGQLLRVLERDIDLGEDGRFVVRVTGPADEIAGAVWRFVAALVTTFLLLGVGLGLSTLLQIRFGLRPLLELRGAVSDVRRGAADRIPERFPSDIAPLAEELNLLIDANQEILDRARTQVGNLAHALKTPLSVLLNEAGRPTADLPGQVEEQATLMRHQLEIYLNRARAAALSRSLGTGTDVGPVLDALGRTFGKIYPEGRVALTVAPSGAIRFKGERQDFEEMAGNLIDNACKWASGRVAVEAAAAVEHERPLLVLTVDDDGPGIPESVRDEAMRRGRRLDETKPGSGLGLSIVADLASLYGGRLSFSASPLGGARAQLTLPGEIPS